MSASAAQSRVFKAGFDHIGGLTPGLLLSAALALAAASLAPITTMTTLAVFGRAITVPPPVLALLIGMALHRVGARPRFSRGTAFAIKKLLRWAIAVFGVKIAVADILNLGMGNVAMVVASMALTMASALMLARLSGLGDLFGAIAGAATAVCGASAALATASMLPDYPGRERDTTFVVIAVNGLATIAMMLYPPLCAALGFNEHTSGIFLGCSIHDVAQVVGAGYAVSETTGNAATIVKLLRVFLLLPVVVVIGRWAAKRRAEANNVHLPVPIFALMFLVFVALNSTGELPSPIKYTLIVCSNAGLVVAMAALGLNTSIYSLLNLGYRQLVVVSGATLVACFVPLVWLATTN